MSRDVVDGEPGIYAVPADAPSMEYDIMLEFDVELDGIIATHMTDVPVDP